MAAACEISRKFANYLKQLPIPTHVVFASFIVPVHHIPFANDGSYQRKAYIGILRQTIITHQNFMMRLKKTNFPNKGMRFHVKANHLCYSNYYINFGSNLSGFVWNAVIGYVKKIICRD